MLDITTRALVLDKEALGEYDSRVFLYTEKLGSVLGYATGTRKLVSKLAAHLEPLSLIDVRLVEKRNHSFQIGDALNINDKINLKDYPGQAQVIFKIISILKESSFIGNPDVETWDLFFKLATSREHISLSAYVSKFLTVLGFNPKHALCARCASRAPRYFLLHDFCFYCQACIPSLNSPILEIA